MINFIYKSALEHNVIIHNKIAKKYERNHGEIYNEIEQSRLHACLEKAISFLNNRDNPILALDFGCGAGNLTRHLSSLGCNVIACDISQGFLDLVASKEYTTNVATSLLNGTDLSNFQDSSVDIVVTYSVLHHIPDYIKIVKEFLRILRPGGVLFIDHEHSESFWHQSVDKDVFLNKTKKINFKKYFIFTNYLDWLIRKVINPRYHREGDIHVFEDDHIVWGEIHRVIIENNAKIVFDEDYLLYRRGYDKSIYDNYKTKVSDMHVLIAVKKS